MKVYCKDCKYAHYDYLGRGRFECYHPKVKKYIEKIDYSTGEDNGYISAPEGRVKNKNGKCKDYEFKPKSKWWKFWI